MMDQNRPAKLLDTAYNALKSNPAATNQIMQAAAQGAPVGLRGLAAAAAQQSQQEAQKAAMAQNIQGPQPSVVQRMAAMPGIMGQLPSNMQLASAPTSPAPQMMAGGGLVAFADGGNVLPPDVIEAIQSHFAEGGDVRGFAAGSSIRSLADIIPDAAGYFKSQDAIDAFNQARRALGYDEEAFLKEMESGYRDPRAKKSVSRSPRSGDYASRAKNISEMAKGAPDGASEREALSRLRSQYGQEASSAATEANAQRMALENESLSERLYRERLEAIRAATEPTRPGYGDVYSRTSPTSVNANQIGRSYASVYPSATQGAAEYSPYQPPAEALPPGYEELYGKQAPEGVSANKIGRSYGSLYPQAERGATEYSPYRPRSTDSSMTAKMAAYSAPEGAAPSMLSEAQKDLIAKKLNWNMVEGSGEAFPTVPESVSRLANKIVPYLKTGAKLLSPIAYLSDPNLQAATKAHTGLAKVLTGMPPEEALSETELEKRAYHLPEKAMKGLGSMLANYGVTGFAPPKTEPAEQQGMLDYSLAPEVAKDIQRAAIKPATYKPKPQDGHDVTFRPEVPPEGRKVYQEFGNAKTDTPSAAVDKGLGGLDEGREMVDYIKGLLGEKKLSPEISQKLADLEDKARTSTIIQSVLGGLAGGLSNPYGGRFALGSAALQSLAGYQRGIGAEEDLQRKSLDIQREYADQPAVIQQQAAKEYFNLLSDKAKNMSAERIAEGRATAKEELEAWKEQQRILHPEVHGAGAYSGVLTRMQEEQILNMRRDDVRKDIENLNKTRAMEGLGPLSEQEIAAMYARYGVTPPSSSLGGAGLGGGQGLGGAVPTGRSIVGGKLTGSAPQ